MNERPQPTSGKPAFSGIAEGLFFLLLCLFVWLVVDPRLIHHSLGILTPSIPFSFSTGWPFLGEHLTRVGGPVEYAARLLSQFYRFGWAGALIIGAAAALTCWCTDDLIRAAGRPQGGVVRYTPAVLILVMCGGYLHPLRSVLSLLVALACFSFYLRLAPRGTAARLAVVALMSVAAYSVAGGGSLLFPGLVAVYELFVGRRRLTALAGMLCVLGVPWAVGGVLFGLAVDEAYRAFLLPDPGVAARARPLTLVLFLFFPAVLATAAVQEAVMARRGHKRRAAKTDPSRLGKILAGMCQERRVQTLRFAAVLLVAAVAAWCSLNTQTRVMLLTDYYSQREMWTKVLDAAGGMPYGVYNVRCNRNVLLALYHTERLGDEMFRYPQTPGADFYSMQYSHKEPYDFFQESRLSLELGHVNLAERYACEALEAVGELPAVIEHLALINIVKDRPDAARVFLNALRKKLFHRRRAEEMLQRLQEDPQMERDPRVGALRRSMVRRDDVSTRIDVEGSLSALLESNPHNRMAFEFLMAHYLCTGRPEQVVANIGRLEDFGYERIPRHFQEAAVVHSIVNAGSLAPVDARVAPEIVEAGERFAGILAGASSRQEAGRLAVEAGWGKTYFFYYSFGVSGL